MDPENVIEAAIENGLFDDKTGINSKPVYTELAEKTNTYLERNPAYI